MRRLFQNAKPAALDKELIRDLASLLDETGLGEIEIEQHGLKVRVARPAAAPTPAPAPAAAPQPAATPAASAAAAETRAAAELAAHPGTVKSPMVGTAYRSAAPGSAPFVEVGSEVKQGQIILIIEAMKTMNQIPAPRDGRVTQVLIADGQPVEYGEPLMVIE